MTKHLINILLENWSETSIKHTYLKIYVIGQVSDCETDTGVAILLSRDAVICVTRMSCGIVSEEEMGFIIRVMQGLFYVKTKRSV